MIKDTLDAFEKHFNEIVGSLIPGGTLLFGLREFGYINNISDLGTIESGVIVLVASFVLSHLVGQLSDLFTHYFFNKYDSRFNGLWKRLRQKTLSQGNDKKKRSSPGQVWFRNITKELQAEHLQAASGYDDLSESNLRSLAMSLSPKAEMLGRRFRFIELFCRYVATTLGLLSIALVNAWFIGMFCATLASAISGALVLLVSGALLFDRGLAFRRRADQTPFICASAEILTKKIDS